MNILEDYKIIKTSGTILKFTHWCQTT